MSAALDRRGRRVLAAIVAFVLLTIVAGVLGVMAWARAPVPMRLEAGIEPNGGTIFLAGHSRGTMPLHLVDEQIFVLSEGELLSDVWPPPGPTSGGFTTTRGSRFESYVVRPDAEGGDYVWHGRLTKMGEEREFAIRVRAIDAQGAPMELNSNMHTTSKLLDARCQTFFYFTNGRLPEAVPGIR
jgi:hypothetical protein